MPAPPELGPALEHIRTADKSFHQTLALAATLPGRRRPEGFDVLTKIIVEQQVSINSAEAIWKRLTDAISPFVPANVLRLSDDDLRNLGLSRQKAKYCHALAHDIQDGRLDLNGLHRLDDEAVLDQLTQVKGIGRWTAEIYMMTSLDRSDIWPAGDVALQTAMQHLKALKTRPNAEQMDELALPLKPYRTVAARLLWQFYSKVVKASRID